MTASWQNCAGLLLLALAWAASMGQARRSRARQGGLSANEQQQEQRQQDHQQQDQQQKQLLDQEQQQQQQQQQQEEQQQLRQQDQEDQQQELQQKQHGAEEVGGVLLLVTGMEEMEKFLARNQGQAQKLEGRHFEAFFGTLTKELPNIDMAQWSSGKENFTDPGDAHNNKARAIWVSHSRVLKHISAKGAAGTPEESRPYLVLEGDVTLRDDWEERLKWSFANTPKDWDLLQVAYWGSRYCPDSVGSKDVYKVSGTGISTRNWRRFAFYSGLDAYVVTPASARKLLKITKASPVRNIDRHFLHLSQDRRINQYAAGRPHMITNDDAWHVPPYSRFLSCSILPF